MMRRRRTPLLNGLLGCLMGIGLTALCSVTAFSATKASTKTSSAGSSAEVSHSDLVQLETKLDQVLANQQTILQKFDAVMEELRIIKVRASIRSG